MSTNTTTTPAAIAARWLDTLARGEREAEPLGRVCVSTDATPDALKAAIYTAHGEGQIMPDDWVYELVHDALACISEQDDADEDGARDRAQQWAADHYVYTHEARAWFASCGLSQEYADEENIGGTVDEQIREGLQRHQEAVWSIVWDAITEAIDEEGGVV